MSPEERLADLKSLEDELKGDDDEEEDDAPTRVMMRPNYFSIQFGQESQGVDSSIAEVIEDEDLPGNTIAGMTKRIQNAVVSEFTMQLPAEMKSQLFLWTTVLHTAEQEQTKPVFPSLFVLSKNRCVR